jgi:hypothetical protein
MAHRLDIVDCMPDDISIAQGLLNRPRIPSRGASFMGPSATHRRMANASWDGPTENPESNNNENEHRRQINSSNTWTSSSGDVLSDQDDIEDRTLFVQEYNRLARKVSGCPNRYTWADSPAAWRSTLSSRRLRYR